MSRLLKNGLIEVDGIEAGGGPEHKRYAITEAGITDMGSPPQRCRHPRQSAGRLADRSA
jgi:hypothetical protein